MVAHLCVSIIDSGRLRSSGALCEFNPETNWWEISEALKVQLGLGSMTTQTGLFAGRYARSQLIITTSLLSASLTVLHGKRVDFEIFYSLGHNFLVLGA